MRGDSVRDFYAKMLALLGLGALAGTGALVDYWPTRIGLPAVPSVLSAAPSIEIAKHHLTPTPVQVAVDTAAAVPVRRRADTQLGLPRIPSEPVVTLAALDVALTAPPLELTTVQGALGEELVISEPTTEMAVDMPNAAPVALASNEDDIDGFFTSTFKRTGSSIVKGGLKTGSSVAEAVRIVSGAVRRALPN